MTRRPYLSPPQHTHTHTHTHSYPYSPQVMSQAAHYHHAARSLLFSAHPGGTSSPTSILLLSIYLFSSQRPLAANVVIEVTRTCQTENNCSFMKTISCTPHRHISYLHVLRPLRTYCSAATRLYNKIVALVSLIVTEVGLVQGPQLRQPLNFGALTTRQFSLPTCGPMRHEVRWMMARPIDCPTTLLTSSNFGTSGILGSSVAVGETRLEPKGHD